MNDSTEVPQEQPDAKSFQMSDRGKSAMQGYADTGSPPTPEKIPDSQFTDNKGHDINIRTYPSGDSAYIRAYDRQRTPQTPETPQVSDVGQANLHLEKDENGKVQSARLQDIIINNPEYRGTGVGSKMLESSEDYAKKAGAKEIYGSFTPQSGEEAELKQWYEKHGYQFRPGKFSGQDVYKTL